MCQALSQALGTQGWVKRDAIPVLRGFHSSGRPRPQTISERITESYSFWDRKEKHPHHGAGPSQGGVSAFGGRALCFEAMSPHVGPSNEKTCLCKRQAKTSDGRAMGPDRPRRFLGAARAQSAWGVLGQGGWYVKKGRSPEAPDHPGPCRS